MFCNYATFSTVSLSTNLSKMESISVFDIFKISVGPSSSHTLGPWKAALDFRSEIVTDKIDRISIELYGSLSKTGKGHATDKALQLGLFGADFEKVDRKTIRNILADIEMLKPIKFGVSTIVFDVLKDIEYCKNSTKEHPNTLTIRAYLKSKLIKTQTYYSVGGGFVKKKGEIDSKRQTELPYPIETAADLRNYVSTLNLTIPEIVMQNEIAIHSKKYVKNRIDLLFMTMKECVVKGCSTEGVLPGGLGVVRRAKKICGSLTLNSITSFEDLEKSIIQRNYNFNEINRWISCFALAVNEENTAMGKVVTAPTNGAAGVIPAVLLYYHFFCSKKYKDDISQFFLTAGELGSLYKKGATISAAMGGCQAEIGVSSSMAAGALTKVLGGNYEQVLMASEIAMEHHLGLTCDPIGGLVQIPCIERNTMGAMKAITAANLALAGNPKNMKVNLDTVIKTMWDTAQDMNQKFKETSEGGLATNISVDIPEC